ncbi:MAG: hypothetical protein JXR59_00435 [Desulfuromonadaceae bacterium]|nr:hypothetical protein [Desulfuromonadaceae bacterium]
MTALMRFLIILFVVVLMWYVPVCAFERHDVATFSAPAYQIENLAAEVFSDGRIILVTGIVKNMSTFPVRGHVEVNFIDRNQSVLRRVVSTVNERKAIKPGGHGLFEASTNINTSLSGLENIYVEFISE